MFLIAAVGGAFEFTRKASANLREKDDHYNTAIGGFVAGSLLGIRSTNDEFPSFRDFSYLERGLWLTIFEQVLGCR